MPALNGVFKTEPLSAVELALAAAVAGLVFVAVETEKWAKRRRGGREPLAARA